MNITKNSAIEKTSFLKYAFKELWTKCLKTTDYFLKNSIPTPRTNTTISTIGMPNVIPDKLLI